MSRGNVYQTLQKLRRLLDEERGPSATRELIGGARRKRSGRGVVSIPSALGRGCMYGGAYIGGDRRNKRAAAHNPWLEFIDMKAHEYPDSPRQDLLFAFGKNGQYRGDYAAWKAAYNLPPPEGAGRRRRRRVAGRRPAARRMRM